MARRAIPASCSLLPAPCTLLPGSLHPAPCFPASLLPLLPCAARLAAVEPRGPFLRGAGRGAAGGAVPGCGRVGWCTPGHTPPGGMPLGYPTTPCRTLVPLIPPHTAPHRARMGLWAQRGSQGPGGLGSHPALLGGVTVSSAILARSAEPRKAGFCKRLDRIQVQAGQGRPGCTGLGGVVIEGGKPWVRDGTGRDGTGRGRDGTGRDGTDGT